MKITDSAIEAIVDIMKRKKLNLSTTFLEVGIFDGNLGISFTRDPFGKKVKMGELTVLMQSNVDSEGVTIDFGEIDGRKGLIFLGDKNGNQSN